ncbi:serine/threonine-protein kinase [Paenibacillus sp. GYB004]|uniref:serine/threonine protein kinase n=1 Tax=Paenibacillus sp. GYB004 TaxID=2994393 RepID=UPI002F96CD80
MNRSTPPAGALPAGTVYGGRYKIIRPLGEGGMSAVYLADDLRLPGKLWAVKRTQLTGISGLTAAHEAAILMKLDHPYLPHVVDYFPPDELGFSHLVMEYVEGITLQQQFERNGGHIPAASLIRYGIQLCELLQYMHELESGPVIFRDIKPSNIMIDTADHVRLIDFGIARKHSPDRPADTVPLGTIGFAAPELIESGRTDYRSDLYSLGATFYYLLSGGRMYHTARKPLALAGGERERLLTELVDRLLDDSPVLRPASASEVKSLLQRCSDPDAYRSDAIDGRAAGGLFPVKRVRVAVGGLYSGAGATFVALALASLLSERGVTNAVVEHPGVRPELYGLLDGERNAPADYLGHAGRASAGRERWTTGLTEWVPLAPAGHAALPEEGTIVQRIYKIDAQVTLIDIGDRWLDHDVVKLLDEADAIVAVADPSPSRWTSPSARTIADSLMRRHAAGRSVHFMANKAVPFGGAKEWLSSFPLRPSAVIPYVPFEEIVKSSWKGKLPQENPNVMPLLHKALSAWLSKSLKVDRQSDSGKGWLGKLFSGSLLH